MRVALGQTSIPDGCAAVRRRRRPVNSTVDIDASKQAVWDVLIDCPAYREWTPFMRIQGAAELGTRLIVHMSAGGGHGMSFKPKVLAASPAEELRWLGRLGIRGIVDGEHYFIVTTNVDGTTHLDHGEPISGVLVALARGNSGRSDTRYEAFSQAPSSVSRPSPDVMTLPQVCSCVVQPRTKRSGGVTPANLSVCDSLNNYCSSRSTA